MPLFQMDSLTQITQRCYRSILGAMSRPGTICLANDWDGSYLRELLSWQTPLPLVALAYTLLDEQVSLAPCGREADPWVREVAAATGCRTAAIEGADYVFCRRVPDISDLSSVRQGDLLLPEEGATVVVWLDAPLDGKAGTLHISGPGVESSVRLQVSSPLLSLVGHRLSIPFEYPMGFDLLILGSDYGVLGLPRSSTIRTVTEGDN